MSQVTKKFADLVAKVVGSNVGELLRQVGEEAVRMAYTGQKADNAQYALDTLPDAWRDPLATWLRARGLIINRKAIGSSRYVVGETSDAGVVRIVKSPKRQQVALEEAKTVPVLAVDSQSVRQPKKAPELKGTAKARADKAASKMVERLKKVDPEAAALLNDRLTAAPKEIVREVVKEVEVAPQDSIVIGSEVWHCTKEELDQAVAAVLAMRVGVRKVA